MDSEMTLPIDKLRECIAENNNFVLQGGAGSGKTEALKQALSFVSDEYPAKKIACITHTNLAVEEIKSRIEGDYEISTIHSFLNEIIKPFKKNLHQEIHRIFVLPIFESGNVDGFSNEKEFRKFERDKYKKLYEKLGRKLFSLLGESLPKVVGKREYDKNASRFNDELNDRIGIVNDYIVNEINKRDWHDVGYNESVYNNFKKMTFGHDSLIEMASFLFLKHPMLSKILIDKFDCIFIDEFQDSSSHVINIFLDILPSDEVTIGLFGDSMQGIYDDGIGSVEAYVSNEKLIKIPKEDNFRCSQQVVDFLNHIRVPIDKLKQKVAFKKINGRSEVMEDRQGTVKVYYSVYEKNRPNAFSDHKEKSEYLKMIMHHLENIEVGNSGYKKLMLTNKSIAENLEFLTLYNLFCDRYIDVKNEIEDLLEVLGLLGLVEICVAYKSNDYNSLMSKLKKTGFVINKLSDKSKVSELLDNIIIGDDGIISVLEYSLENKLIDSSNNYDWYVKNKDSFLNQLLSDQEYQNFKHIYLNGGGTFPKFEACVSDFFSPGIGYTGRESSYNALRNLYKKEKFYADLFSNKIKFKEVISFCDYINESAEFITMHKTKGTGIDKVLVVLDDFFWVKYQFNSLFDIGDSTLEMKSRVQKLFYVACSRAKTNLIIFKLITLDEEEAFKAAFSSNVKFFKI